MLIFKTMLRKYGPSIVRSLPKTLIVYCQNKYVYEPRMESLNITGVEDPPLFDTVFFEVRTLCNGRCSFCAASIQNETRTDQSMSFELYDKVISELAEFDFEGRIAYHVNNDPLIFKELQRFVDNARQKLPRAWIQILTNGVALTTKKAEALIAGGINEITIDWYNDDLESALPKKFDIIRNEILPKYYAEDQIQAGHYAEFTSERIFRWNIFRRLQNEVLNSRGGTAPNKQEKSMAPRGFCEYPFTQFNITANGKVSKCCSDLYFSDVMGDVNKNTVLEIWNNDHFRNVREKLIIGDRVSLKNCAGCDFYGSKRLPSIPARIINELTQ
ncbi:MAG: SPASM domain-containing protein [Arenicellaceae bacterium]|nr:SPASM domain-containing protein [Arenicellaceae bacterium]